MIRVRMVGGVRRSLGMSCRLEFSCIWISSYEIILALLYISIESAMLMIDFDTPRPSFHLNTNLAICLARPPSAVNCCPYSGPVS